MRRHARTSIAALRRWRRAVSAAVVPVFAWWSLSAAACFGMPFDVAGGAMSAVAHADDAGSPHAAHGTANDVHEHAGMPDCTHCPPEADDSQSTPTICLTGGTSNANAPKASAPPDFFKLFTELRLPTLSWAAPLPPPILTAVGPDAPYVEHRPLNVLHCVFLI